MPIGPARMPLMEHLGELRMRLVRIVVVLLVALIVFYLASPTVINILIQPISDFLPVNENGQQLNVIGSIDPFTIPFKVSFWTSIVATSPFILWQILAFFLPALKPNERKWFIPTFAAAVALFITGTVFCYFVILHPAFEWLTAQTSGWGTLLPDAKSYIDIIIGFEIGFGVAFELPIVVFYLVLFNIVPYRKLRESWRIVYTVLIVFSACVTPDANPVTMLLLFAALIGLYELSLLFARIALARKIKRQEQEEKELYGEDGDE